MYRRLQLLIPGFLRNIDHYLLLQHPAIWATRVHYVAFYSLLAWGMFFLSSFAMSPANLPNVDLHVGLMLLPSLASVGFWAYWVYHTRVERQFGKMGAGREGLTQLLYLVCLMLMLSQPLVYGYIQVRGIQRVIPQEQLRQDLLSLESGEHFFQEQFMNLWKFHQASDSQFGDNLFVDGLPAHPLGSESISDLADQQLQLQQIQEFNQAVFRYSGKVLSHDPGEVLLAYHAGSPLAWTTTEDELYEPITAHLTLAARAHNFSFIFFWSNFIHGVLFLALLGGLAFLVFAKVSFRQFVIAVAAGMAVLIAIGIATAFVSFLISRQGEIHFRHGEETLFSMFFLLAFGAMTWQAFSRTRSGIGRFWQPIHLSMASMMLPFLPMASMVLVFYLGGLKPQSAFSSGETTVFFLFQIPMVLSFVVWYLIFRSRFRQLESAPLRK